MRSRTRRAMPGARGRGPSSTTRPSTAYARSRRPLRLLRTPGRPRCSRTARTAGKRTARPRRRPTARIVCSRRPLRAPTVVSWRDLDDPASESPRTRRTWRALLWSGGHHHEDEFGISRIYNIPFSTGNLEQVSFGPTASSTPSSGWRWVPAAPDRRMVQFSAIAIYRQVDGVRTKINQFAIPVEAFTRAHLKVSSRTASRTSQSSPA